MMLQALWCFDVSICR